MDFINSNKEYDLVTMGEVMLRLSPPGTDKISQSYTFDKKAGGAELNVARVRLFWESQRSYYKASRK